MRSFGDTGKGDVAIPLPKSITLGSIHSSGICGDFCIGLGTSAGSRGRDAHALPILTSP